MEMGDSSSRFEAREDGADLCCVRGRAEIALGMMMRRWRRSSSRRGRRRGRVGWDMPWRLLSFVLLSEYSSCVIGQGKSETR